MRKEALFLAAARRNYLTALGCGNPIRAFRAREIVNGEGRETDPGRKQKEGTKDTRTKNAGAGRRFSEHER
jgi:hypothetical protein